MSDHGYRGDTMSRLDNAVLDRYGVDDKLGDKLRKRYPMVELLQLPLKQRKDSFFYEGEVARIKSAYATYYLVAAGNVRIRIGNNYLRDSDRFKYIDSLKLTDRKINNDKVRWDNNNWFEVVWNPRGSKERECGIGDITFDYEGGIALLKSYADENHGFTPR